MHIQFQLSPEVDKEVKVLVLFENTSQPLLTMIAGQDGTIGEPRCSDNLLKSPGFENVAVGPTKMQNISFEEIQSKARDQYKNPFVFG